ncbi:zinc ribbon domain-containing protein [Gloeocapsopsis dulcis]|uniref:zinc ribbon domain-containing protein n=1 Tax=Gloeocapsopsis dulcis TaxID=2859516 RepID=UPI0018C47970
MLATGKQPNTKVNSSRSLNQHLDPRYTSKTCHCCNVIGKRKGKSFKCVNTTCNWTGDADYNGATNIKKLGATLVNSPRGSELFCSLEQVVLGLPKASTITLCG